MCLPSAVANDVERRRCSPCTALGICLFRRARLPATAREEEASADVMDRSLKSHRAGPQKENIDCAEDRTPPMATAGARNTRGCSTTTVEADRRHAPRRRTPHSRPPRSTDGCLLRTYMQQNATGQIERSGQDGRTSKAADILDNESPSSTNRRFRTKTVSSALRASSGSRAIYRSVPRRPRMIKFQITGAKASEETCRMEHVHQGNADLEDASTTTCSGSARTYETAWRTSDEWLLERLTNSTDRGSTGTRPRRSPRRIEQAAGPSTPTSLDKER